MLGKNEVAEVEPLPEHSILVVLGFFDGVKKWQKAYSEEL
jgi:hypothetical protein